MPIRIIFLLSISISFSQLLAAEYFIPGSIDFVVSQSYVSESKKKQQLQSELDFLDSDHFSTPSQAIKKAENFLDQYKATKDLRFAGLAETVLKPWWNDRSIKVIQMHKAHILQLNHKFFESNKVLSDLLTTSPNDLQALLLRFNNSMLLGEYQAAFNDCVSIAQFSSPIISGACLISIKGLQVSKEQAKEMVFGVLKIMSQDGSLRLSDRQWLTGLLIDVLVFHGAYDDAEKVIRSSFSNKVLEDSMLIVLAEILLKLDRPHDVLDLSSKTEMNISLLTYIVIAEQKLNKKFPTPNKAKLGGLLEVEQRRGEMGHLRERALLRMYLDNDYEQAYWLAKQNWNRQKNVFDAELLAITAKNAGESAILQSLVPWKEKNQLAIDFKLLMAGI